VSSLFHKKEFLIAILVLVMVSLSCNSPVSATQNAPTELPRPKATNTSLPKAISATHTPEPTRETAPTEASLPQADFGGVTFSYDPQIASAVSGEEEAATDPGQGAPWEVQPATIRFSFDGYPVADSFTAPVILIFPVKEYQSMSEEAGKVIEELRQVIASQPQPTFDKGYPFLPMWNAAQIMRTKVAYFSFANGQGVRYLTQYGQGISPLNNKYLFYTYQGLTSDGKYYVSAILPVTNAILPPDESVIPGGDYQKFSDNYLDYLNGMVDKLDAQSEDAFVPSLTALDNLIKSIAINK
jgi:hypothetical protein